MEYSKEIYEAYQAMLAEVRVLPLLMDYVAAQTHRPFDLAENDDQAARLATAATLLHSVIKQISPQAGERLIDYAMDDDVPGEA